MSVAVSLIGVAGTVLSVEEEYDFVIEGRNSSKSEKMPYLLWDDVSQGME